MDSYIPAKPALNKVGIESIPKKQPVQRMMGIYRAECAKLSDVSLPRMESLLPRCSDELLSYCLILQPVLGEPYLDFITLAKGVKIPGIETATIASGELYSEKLEPSLVPERLMELASCLVLKSPRLTETTSARPSTLNVKVYRGVFPVWQSVQQTSAVILMIAPVYSEV